MEAFRIVGIGRKTGYRWRAYGDHALVAALEQAVEFRRSGAEDVHPSSPRIGAPHPRPAGDALVPVRPLSAYRSVIAVSSARQVITWPSVARRGSRRWPAGLRTR